MPGETISCQRSRAGHWWSREGVHGVWWIPDEAPGPLGSPELWIDESAMDMYGRGDSAPVVTVVPVPGRPEGAIPWIGAVIRFEPRATGGATVVYQVKARRWSRENGGRPYYVCTWPD